MFNKRIVVTGLGVITPLGIDLSTTWNRLLNSESGIVKIDGEFYCDDLLTRIGAPVQPQASTLKSKATMLDIGRFGLTMSDIKKHDKFGLYALIAADQAIQDSCILSDPLLNYDKVGVCIGSGIGGLGLIEKNSIILHEEGVKKVTPFFIPASLINLPSGHISIKYGFKGPNDSNVTACATGGHSIINAFRTIQMGEADVIVTGAAEGALCRIGIAGFNALKALSTQNDFPEKASRPWDKARDGFVMGEGGGVIVIESYDNAIRRGAKIYAEIVGYGLSADAHHYTAPPENGEGALNAMKKAIQMANISPEKIGYVNAHGTSTALGDKAEVVALKSLYGDKINSLAVSSTKSAIGHLLGAAGSVEAVLTILSLYHGILPPTLNLDDPEDFCKGINFVPHKSQEKKLQYAMSNSFGFGGTNISIIFKSMCI